MCAITFAWPYFDWFPYALGSDRNKGAAVATSAGSSKERQSALSIAHIYHGLFISPENGWL